MSLADDIRGLGVRTDSAMSALHDYYTHTKAAWRLVQLHIDQGNEFLVSNQTTGTVVNQRELLDLAQGYVSDHLAASTFKQAFSQADAPRASFSRPD